MTIRDEAGEQVGRVLGALGVEHVHLERSPQGEHAAHQEDDAPVDGAIGLVGPHHAQAHEHEHPRQGERPEGQPRQQGGRQEDAQQGQDRDPAVAGEARGPDLTQDEDLATLPRALEVTEVTLHQEGVPDLELDLEQPLQLDPAGLGDRHHVEARAGPELRAGEGRAHQVRAGWDQGLDEPHVVRDEARVARVHVLPLTQRHLLREGHDVLRAALQDQGVVGAHAVVRTGREQR